MLSIVSEVETGLLDDMVGRLDNSGSLLTALGDDLLTHEKQAFATAGFGQWAPNNPVTAALKGSSRVLVDTGDLMRELTSRGSLKMTSDSVEVTTNHRGAVMAARGARGAPVRVATPTPDQRTMSALSGTLLAALMGER